MSESLASFLVACPRACEKLLFDELVSLDLDNLEIVPGGVTFKGSFTEAQKVCLWSRIAGRVYKPIAQVDAKDGEMIYRNALEVEWDEYLDTTSTFAIQGIGTSDTIRHSGFLALKVKDAVVDRMRRKTGFRPNVDKENPDVRFVARLYNGKLDLSLDVSGESLHKRGWRKGQTVDAPLKENLAAAIVRASGYCGQEVLWEPMCGSGTLLIEALEYALGWAPGRRKMFGFEKWPFLARSLKRDFKDRRRAIRRPQSNPIEAVFASDIDKNALQITEKHLEATGLIRFVRLEHQDAFKIKPPPGKCTILANPPYGERLEIPDEELMYLYTGMGEAWKQFEDARLAIFCSNPKFRKAFALKPAQIIEMANGSIPTKLFLYDVGKRWSGVKVEAKETGEG